MHKRKWTLSLVAVVLLGSGLPGLSHGAKGVDKKDCFSCHAEVEKLYSGSTHGKLACETCHSGLADHLKDETVKPVTSLELSTCGQCHKDQFSSFYRVDWEAQARKEKGVPTGRSPMQDKLIAPYGFTKEHNEPRSHAFMVVDQFVVDRFAAGRYQFKDMFGYTRPGKAWDVLTDSGKMLRSLTWRVGLSVGLFLLLLLAWRMGYIHPHGLNPGQIQ